MKYRKRELSTLGCLESNYTYKTQENLLFLILRNWKDILQPKHNVNSKILVYVVGIAILLLKTQGVREKTWANPSLGSIVILDS